MRAAELETEVLPGGRTDVAEPWRDLLDQRTVKVIILWSEDEDEEQAAWEAAGASVFLEGDGPHDSLYDDL